MLAKTFSQTIAASLTMLAVASASAYSFPKYQIHAFTHYGVHYDRLDFANAADFLSVDTFTASNGNNVYGINFDIGRFYNRYNNLYFNQKNLPRVYVGLDLAYSHVRLAKISGNKQDAQVASNVDPEFYLKTADGAVSEERVLNSFNLGALSRVYFNDALFVSLSSGLNQTFEANKKTVKAAGKALENLVKGNNLSLYTGVGLGYDIGKLSAAVLGKYIYGTQKRVGYATIVLALGWSFEF